jgi:cell division protein FtsW
MSPLEVYTMGLIESINEAGIPFMTRLAGVFHDSGFFPDAYTTIARWIFVILALFIFIKSIRSLWAARGASEIWAYLILPDGTHTPLTHWESVIGRSKSADVVVDIMTVSRNHGLLVRDDQGNWRYNDLGSSGGTQINGNTVYKSTPIEAGDTISLAGAECLFIPASLEERLENLDERRKTSFVSSPIASLLALSLFQLMLAVQLIVAEGKELPLSVLVGIFGLMGIMWGFWAILRLNGLRHFEIETIAFFLCTLNLAVTASSSPDEVIKQLIAIFLGVCLFFGLCLYLRDLSRTLWVRRFLVFGSVILLLVNLVFGTLTYGSTNWVSIGGFSFQPSEFVKIAFIFIGSATLEELYQKKNLGLFMVFSLFCLGCLAVMGDFGTAAIFFVTYLVISFLRSGEFSKLFLTVGGALGAGLMILRFKPYIAARFETWGHAWEYADAGGFQQTRTMTAGASGGLIGVGGGEGWLHNVFAADTDLVFGILSEEWGLIIAVLAVLSIFALGVFAYRSILAGRSSFYTIAACSATSLFVFQTMLNVFGSVDLFPLTGVTFPFVSNGGSSMMASWGLLAFLKAADTRQDASLAVTGGNSDDLEGGTL